LSALQDYLVTFFKGEKAFFKDTSIVFSGKFFIAVLALLTTPILTRLYDPEAYGTFALFNSAVQNLVILGTLALPSALLTTKKKYLINYLKLTLVVIAIFSIVIAIVLYSFSFSIGNKWTYLSVFRDYWYLVPIGFLLTSGTLTLSSLQLRLKKFALTTKINVTEAITAKTTNLINGILKMGGLGLILGDLIAKLAGLIILIVRMPKQLSISKRITWAELRLTFNKVRSYPLFVMPAQWASILSTQLILWIIAYKFSAYELGKYTVAIALLNIPLYILSNSFQPVITQRFVDARDANNETFSMKKILGLLAAISFLVFGGLFVIPSSWFVYFLGEQWLGIGAIIKLLCGWHLFLFIDQSINNGFLAFDKQRQKLYLNLVDLGLQVGILTISILFPIELYHFIVFFVLTKVIASVIRIGYVSYIGYIQTSLDRNE
jgi:O-antigen/teichoic acid export membrane protein